MAFAELAGGGVVKKSRSKRTGCVEMMSNQYGWVQGSGPLRAYGSGSEGQKNLLVLHDE